MYIHDYACIYIYTQLCLYTIMYCIYICTYLYIYTQPNLMREDDCTDMFVDNFLFMAEQLRNVSAIDAVCALQHISTSGLLALGYIVIYIYTCVYIMCMHIHDYACINKYIYICIHTQLCIYIYTIFYRLRNVLADIKWTGKKKQMDGPARIRARNHLLPRLLQNAPGALGGVQVKNHCVGLRPAPPLAEAKVTQLATASFRDKAEMFLISCSSWRG